MIGERIKIDLRCKEVMKRLDVDAKKVLNYKLKDKLLKYERRVVVSNMKYLTRKILDHFHNTKERGHSGLYHTWVSLWLICSIGMA